MPTYLDTKTERRVKAYSEALGISPEFFVSRIMNEWLTEKGDFVAKRVAFLALGKKDSITSGLIQTRRTSRATISASQPEAKKNVASITSSPRFKRAITQHYTSAVRLSAVP